jgi:cellulose synthase/poly-beta-1,6-N-acetylglucosamine synthase-like glycosyltransferase
MLIYIVSLLLIIIGLLLLLLIYIKNKNWNKNRTLISRKCNNYSILIPARNESSVIENLLISIKKQVNLNDTYVIVESIDDPTIQIVKKYNGNIIIRKDLEGKHRKGYALDEAIKDIKKKYDLYFIFDADNIVGDNFFKEMVSLYEKGYDVGEGYRNIKNNVNIITTCSGLIFSLINTLINKTRNKLNKSIIISGTGFFISGQLIKKWQGFPFYSLTEDYELSLYCSANNLNTYYYDKVQFFDEQPETMKKSIIQRTRWVKGFFEARKIRIQNIKNDFSKTIGVTPYIFLLLGFFISIIYSLFKLILKIINHGNYLFYIKIIVICMLIIYIALQILTIILLIKDHNHLNINKNDKIKAIFYNPIFLLTFINCLFKSFNDVKWETIKHGK